MDDEQPWCGWNPVRFASEIAKFVTSESKNLCLEPGRQKELGFIFSFQVQQTAIASSRLIQCSKEFSVSEMVDKDVVVTSKDFIERQGLDIHISDLVNDAVSTFTTGRYHDEDVMVALIFGHCTNACCVEHADAIPKCQGLLSKSGYMVINTEWGNFGSSYLPVTEFDKALNAESVNPSK